MVWAGVVSGAWERGPTHRVRLGGSCTGPEGKHVSVHLHPKPRWKLNQLEGVKGTGVGSEAKGKRV